ncbi:MAG TPA: ComEC/Rec2 family competence protein [Clostridia bacterium]|nr:ComEC/Rec2 family competence protein [Clostridia bacterium]
MFAACVAFASGIIFGRHFWHPPVVLLSAFALILVGAVVLALRRNTVAAGSAALVLFSLCGAFAIQARDAAVSPASPLLRHSEGEEVSISGYVIRDGVLRQSPFGGQQQSVDIAVEQVMIESRSDAVSGSVRLNIFERHRKASADADGDDEEQSASKQRLLVYGERVSLTAKLRPPLNYGNPGALDYRGYLRAQGIDLLGTASTDAVNVLPGHSGSAFADLRSRMRRSILARIHALWPAPQAGLLDAMLIGERAYIGPEWREAFQRSGTYHVLVVSGMNVGILAFVLFWVLKRIRAGELTATLVTLFVTCGYAYLADSGAPIVRAALMLAIYLATRLLYRQRAALNAVGVAALIILAADPGAILDASFQLTFLSVVAIGGIALPLLERTSEPYRRALRMFGIVGYDQVLDPKHAQFRLDLRMIAGRLSRFLGKSGARFAVVTFCATVLGAYEVLLVSELMQVALALPMIWYFHRATLLALPANALVVPLTGVLMPASVAAVALSYVSQSLAAIPAWIASWALEAVTGAVKLVGASRMSDVRMPSPSVTMAVLAAASFALSLLLARRRALLCATGLFTLTLCAFLLVTYSPHAQLPRGLFELTAIDVGQGDSFLIVSPEGKTLLLDSGGMLGNGNADFDIGEDVVSPYLWTRGIARLDAVAFSHGHLDHMGGMRAIVRNFQPRELWMAEANLSTPELEALLDIAAEYGVSVRRRAAGEVFDFGGLHFQVLAPPRDWELKARVRDEDAMVLRISYGENSVLMVGDAGRRIERELVKNGIRADLLKVGHHGSITATSPEFLAALRPKLAVISVGRRNTFRHPRPEVLARLAEAHVSTYRTDTMGIVSFYLDGSSIRIAPYRR